MAPQTHLLLSWLIANATPGCADPAKRRARFAITAAGVLPDVDGLGLVAGVLSGSLERGREWFHEYHHVMCHNGLSALVVAAVLGAWCRSWWVVLGCLVTFHLHLVCDLIGARGPDGNQFPIPYLNPFSSEPALTWSGQWALNAWPNFVITASALAISAWLAHRRGYWFLDLFNRRFDRRALLALRLYPGGWVDGPAKPTAPQA